MWGVRPAGGWGCGPGLPPGHAAHLKRVDTCDAADTPATDTGAVEAEGAGGRVTTAVAAAVVPLGEGAAPPTLAELPFCFAGA